ncbi:IS3 family transposase [Shewanella cyperi]|nr:IS3 family transposase [Shewanella cyperi]
MGIEPLHPKPRATQSHLDHRVYPYLLCGMNICRLNQAWAIDITYIPMDRGFVYLTAVGDWFSRRVLFWKLSVTMDVHFCLEAVEEAIEKHGPPEIMNTDQGSQFTSQAFTGAGSLKQHNIRNSMDGKDSWRDNVFVERPWRSVKYEDVYLHAYDTTSDARLGLKRYFEFYNGWRPHSRLDGQTPEQFYFSSLPETVAA